MRANVPAGEESYCASAGQRTQLVRAIFAEALLKLTFRDSHVFYQLLAGLSAEQKAALKLTKPQDYRYLSR